MTAITNETMEEEELLPLVNAEGEVTGVATRGECHSGSKLLHPVVHLHVINSKGELYLQKRPMHKIQPGRWDTSVGGHISAGEEVEVALRREAKEELGLEHFTAVAAGRYIWESDIERELVNSFVTWFDGEVRWNAGELDDGRFWTAEEIKESVGKGIFTPNFEEEFPRIEPYMKRDAARGV